MLNGEGAAMDDQLALTAIGLLVVIVLIVFGAVGAVIMSLF